MGGKIVAIVGQIASGKTTLVQYLERTGFERIVSYATRKPRDGEVDGKDYYFITEEDFLIKLEGGFFAEHTEYTAEFGHVYYGTGEWSLAPAGETNRVIILNPAGVMALKEAGYDIFVVHLDFDQATLMRRALARKDSPTEIARRIVDDSQRFAMMEAANCVDLRITDPEMAPYEIADRLHKFL